MLFHRKSSRVHLRSNLAGMTVCGLDTLFATRTTTHSREVTCGNCITVAATSGGEPATENRAHKQFYYDSGKGGVTTLWERDGEAAYACASTGARLPTKFPWPADQAYWRTVEAAYGPMTPTTLADVLALHVAGMEARLREVE